MKTIEKIKRKKQDSILIRQSIFTFLISTWNFTLLRDNIPLLFNFSKFEMWVSLVLGVVVFPLLLCIYASLRLPEKRIISLKNVHMVTIIFLILFEYQNFITDFYYFLMFGGTLIILYLLGDLDNLTIRLIGISGSSKDCFFKTYICNKDFEKTCNMVKTEEIKKALGTSEEEKENNSFILYPPYIIGESGERIFIYLKEHPNLRYTTVVNLIAYYVSKFGIERRKTSEYYLTMVTGLLDKIVGLEPSREEYYKEKSLEFALKPTRNLLSRYIRSPKVQVGVVISIIIFITFLLYYQGLLGENIEPILRFIQILITVMFGYLWK